MFAYIEGKVDYMSPSRIHLDVGGVGYEIELTLTTYEAVQHKKACRLFIHSQIREDAWVLYGFATEKERASFRKLISVSGVGAATARLVLSSLSPAQLHQIIEAGDSKALEQVKGIGGKTAKRLILELKGKLPEVDESEEKDASQHNRKAQDALNALQELGISKAMASKALKTAQSILSDKDYSVEEWIKIALKNI